jgi:hypothetical protein
MANEKTTKPNITESMLEMQETEAGFKVPITALLSRLTLPAWNMAKIGGAKPPAEPFYMSRRA